jgi:hypothetical protein
VLVDQLEMAGDHGTDVGVVRLETPTTRRLARENRERCYERRQAHAEGKKDGTTHADLLFVRGWLQLSELPSKESETTLNQPRVGCNRA